MNAGKGERSQRAWLSWVLTACALALALASGTSRPAAAVTSCPSLADTGWTAPGAFVFKISKVKGGTTKSQFPVAFGFLPDGTFDFSDGEVIYSGTWTQTKCKALLFFNSAAMDRFESDFETAFEDQGLTADVAVESWIAQCKVKSKKGNLVFSFKIKLKGSVSAGGRTFKLSVNGKGKGSSAGNVVALTEDRVAALSAATDGLSSLAREIARKTALVKAGK